MFKPKNTLEQKETKVLKRFTIANSQVLTVGDAVQLTSGFVVPGGTTGAILGIVVDIINDNGTPMITDGTTGAALGSYRGTYTAASDNQTVAKVKAIVNLSTEAMYSVNLDANPGTTSGSNLVGAQFNLADEDVLDESTVSTPGTQFKSFGVDPDDSTRVIVKILTGEFADNAYDEVGS